MLRNYGGFADLCVGVLSLRLIITSQNYEDSDLNVIGSFRELSVRQFIIADA